MVSETDAMGGVKTATYDLLGNVTGGTSKAGETITNTYNDWNLPMMQTVAGADRTDTKSFTYDNLGRKTSATNDSGTATYEYDDFGRMVKETDVTGAVKEYTYDENGNRTSFKLTIDGTQQMNATYTYDKLNQLTSVTIGGDTTEYGYDANGNILNKTTGQLITEYAYNQGNMLTQMATTHPNKSYPVNEYAASYYMDGNLKLREGSQWADYTYDGLGRLIKDNGSMTTYYTYDAYGNISRKEQQLVLSEYEFTDYTYNANNQLVQSSADHFDYLNDSWRDITMTQYVYDPNGNLISETPQSRHLSGGTESISIGILGELPADDTMSIKQYTYDGFGQRTGAVVNDKTATYAYNPDGLRVSKTVNGETTTHILDGSNVVADVTNGSISKYNRGRGLISIDQNGKKGYYVFNGHGDVTQIIDSAGVTKDSFDFTAFGERAFAYSDTESFHNPFGYAGEYTDRETDHIYLRARYYDPVTGRFTSQDPLQVGNNWYTYCENNPVFYVDYTGLYPGQPFDSPEAAVENFGVEYYGVTAEMRLELATLIYSYTDENGNTKYSYAKPMIGGPHQSNPDAVSIPDGATIEADVHTHPNGKDFSSHDKQASENQNRTSYLIAPGEEDGTFSMKKFADSGLDYSDGSAIWQSVSILPKTPLTYKSVSIWDKVAFADRFLFKQLWDSHVLDEERLSAEQKDTPHCKRDDFLGTGPEYDKNLSGVAWEMQNGQLISTGPTYAKQRADRQFNRRYSGFDQDIYFN